MLKQLFSRPRLPQALLQNDLKLLLKAIRAGEDLNQPFRLPTEPQSAVARVAVEQALRLHHPECLQKLLEAGAELPATDHNDRLLLNCAILAPQQALALTTTLLQAGADPSAREGEAMLTCLALKDDNQVLLLLNRLLQYGANLNHHPQAQPSLLSRLISDDRTMLVGALISAGAELPDDIDALDGSDALKQFARRKAQDIAIRQQFLAP